MSAYFFLICKVLYSIIRFPREMSDEEDDDSGDSDKENRDPSDDEQVSSFN